MPFEHKEGSGSLFKNKFKTEANNQPHARGDAMIGGVLYEVSAWTKEGEKGKWQSLAFKPKEAAPVRREPLGKHDSGSIQDLESDLPF
jgi:hypothetical protein